MRLAAILLLIILGTHYAYAPLASFYPDPDAAARALFYVARGLGGLCLFALVGLLVRRPVVWVVCFWGAIEEGETAVCRVAHGIGSPVKVDLFDGLCGPGWYWGGVVVAALFAVWFSCRGSETK